MSSLVTSSGSACGAPKGDHASEETVVVPNTANQLKRLAAIGDSNDYSHCLTVALEINRRLPVATVQAAVDHIVATNGALRARFKIGHVGHEIHPAARVRVEHVVTTGKDLEARRQQAEHIARSETTRPFDLSAAGLMRAVLVAIDVKHQLLVLSWHQLIIDAWSAQLIVDQLVDALNQLLEDQHLPEAQDDGRYVQSIGEITRWERSEQAISARERRLAAVRNRRPELLVECVPDQPVPGLVHVTHEIDGVNVDDLMKRARAVRCSLFPVALAAWALMLRSWTGQAQVSVTSTYAVRETPSQERVIGWLSNQVLLALPSSDGHVSFAEFVTACRAETVRALASQRVSYTALCEAEPSCRVDLDHSSVSLLYLPYSLSGGDQADLRIGSAAVMRSAVSICPTGADIDLYIAERPRLLTKGSQPGIVLGASSRQDRVGRNQLEDIVARWAAVLCVTSQSNWNAAIDRITSTAASKDAQEIHPGGEVQHDVK